MRTASVGSSGRGLGNSAGLSTLHVDRKTYRLPVSLQLGLALFEIVFSLATLLLAFWVIVGPLAFLLGLLVMGADAIMLAGPVLAGVVFLVPFAIMTHRVLTLPIEITIDDDRTISLKSWFGSRSIPAAEIISIRTGGRMDQTGFYAQIEQKQGKIYLLNRFPEFREFLITVKSLNPAVEISGF